MLTRKEKQELKRYRHLIACLIDCSIGYFTPMAALRAIKAHKKKEPYCCEWYMDIAYKQRKNQQPGKQTDNDEQYKEINKNIIRSSLRYRKHKSHKGCLAIVDRNINGNESFGASWF